MKKRPADRGALYTVAVFVLRVMLWLFCGVRTRGREHVPAQGPVIFLCNHAHALDPMALAVCVRPRQPHFMAKAELFRKKWLAFLLRAVHAFPVERGKADLSAMREAWHVLRRGAPLGIFPEGHRYTSGEMGEIKSGAAVLALKFDVPVIPTFIYGSFRLFGRTRVIVDSAMDLRDLRQAGTDKETCDACVKRMRQALESLRDQCAAWAAQG
ncbi:MAG: 1-acyl-sn-glycerol-3-phosphate acyltransferase [Oscillospiraceae bacterium]|jgi:1-acyl-sn-glycerol-3-phosphate acyltransferase|nr:1-acyl-sn-glycerol-3-phosphate acyltransferase [Oscillospiraceae bacterium]